MKDFFTNHEIHVCGIQRSGQHAITSWLIGLFDKTCYRDSLSRDPENKNLVASPTSPFCYFDLLKYPNFEYNTSGKLLPDQDAIILGSEYVNGPLILPPNIDKEKDEITKAAGYQQFSQNRFHILVTRSAHNHLASVINCWKHSYKLRNINVFINCWVMMARECLGVTNSIPEPKIVIKFDTFFKDEQYRKSIAARLGVPFTDRGLNYMLWTGTNATAGEMGSSFDHMQYQGKACKMMVLDRWQSCIKNTDHWSRINGNKELITLHNQLFGPLPKVIRDVQPYVDIVYKPKRRRPLSETIRGTY